MGLKKHEMLPNGVQLNYHRIVTLTQHVNNNTFVEVQSYTSQAKRKEEQAAIAANQAAGEAVAEYDAYTETRFFNWPYDPEMTVAKAYKALKELPEFEGAEEA